MEGSCSGAPGTPATDAEYKARSPINFLSIAKGGHEAEIAAAWKWLARQKKGSPANFEVPKSALETKKEIPEVKQVEK
jgi:hypothetical protein